MPTVEKTHGGRVYLRSLGRLFSAGDKEDVSEGMAAYLCDERGDFERVDQDGEPDDESDAADEGGLEWEDDDLVGSFDPTDHTVDEIEAHVEKIDGDDIVAELEAIREAEASGEDRTTALEAIDARLSELEEA